MVTTWMLKLDTMWTPHISRRVIFYFIHLCWPTLGPDMLSIKNIWLMKNTVLVKFAVHTFCCCYFWLEMPFLSLSLFFFSSFFFLFFSFFFSFSFCSFFSFFFSFFPVSKLCDQVQDVQRGVFNVCLWHAEERTTQQPLYA